MLKLLSRHSLTRPAIRNARPINAEKQFSSKKCLAWFHEYAGPDKVVGPEAMEKFCEDIGVEPENVSSLPGSKGVSGGFQGVASLQCVVTKQEGVHRPDPVPFNNRLWCMMFWKGLSP